MGFVVRLETEFYGRLRHQRVVIFSALDVDAVAACCLLQTLFQRDNIYFSTVPVESLVELDRQFASNSHAVKFFIFINCGGSVNLVELLQPASDVTFFVVDSHRPFDVNNVYDSQQVKLLAERSEVADLPAFNSIFREDADSTDSEAESDEDETPVRSHEQRILRRRERRVWRQKREELLFSYSAFTYHGTSAALTLYNLAWNLTKDTNPLLWLAVVGVTDQFLHERIDRDAYLEVVGQLQNHVSRLNSHLQDNRLTSRCAMRIIFDTDLALDLYRHWTVYESLLHSHLPSCKFQTWTSRGVGYLKEFLADVGIPLTQSKQKFTSMDSDIRSNLKNLFSARLEKYGFEQNDFLLPTFRLESGFRHRFCASDYVYAVSASLEGSDPPADCFVSAMEVLEGASFTPVFLAIEEAKLQHSHLLAQLQSLLEQGRVSRLRQLLVAELSADSLPRPHYATRLVKRALEASFVSSRRRELARLPLLLTITLEEAQVALAVGCPPLSRPSKSCFSAGFEQAAAVSKAAIEFCSFEPNVVMVRHADLDRFKDALAVIMQ